jgi:hypothetical protein
LGSAARCTARHGVGSHAVPPTIEWAIPTGEKSPAIAGDGTLCYLGSAAFRNFKHQS